MSHLSGQKSRPRTQNPNAWFSTWSNALIIMCQNLEIKLKWTPSSLGREWRHRMKMIVHQSLWGVSKESQAIGSHCPSVKIRRRVTWLIAWLLWAVWIRESLSSETWLCMWHQAGYFLSWPSRGQIRDEAILLSLIECRAKAENCAALTIWIPRAICTLKGRQS